MRFDLVDLRLFLHVADAHSITHGARRANLALASVSERIRGMEKTLGVALLARDRRGVSLSPAGQCLLEHARLIVQQAERMRGDLACYARGMSGTVSLLSNTSAISEHLPLLYAPSKVHYRTLINTRALIRALILHERIDIYPRLSSLTVLIDSDNNACRIDVHYFARSLGKHHSS